MKTLTKVFSQDKDFVGGMEIDFEVPTIEDLIEWVNEDNQVALENVERLLHSQLKSHEYSSMATRDGGIYSDPKSSKDEKESAKKRLNGVYKLDWTTANFGRTKRGSRWQGYGIYVPMAQANLRVKGILKPSDEEVIKECENIKAKLEG